MNLRSKLGYGTLLALLPRSAEDQPNSLSTEGAAKAITSAITKAEIIAFMPVTSANLFVILKTLILLS
jgi:hypothetical protein